MGKTSMFFYGLIVSTVMTMIYHHATHLVTEITERRSSSPGGGEVGSPSTSPLSSPSTQGQWNEVLLTQRELLYCNWILGFCLRFYIFWVGGKTFVKLPVWKKEQAETIDEPFQQFGKCRSSVVKCMDKIAWNMQWIQSQGLFYVNFCHL